MTSPEDVERERERDVKGRVSGMALIRNVLLCHSFILDPSEEGDLDKWIGIMVKWFI